MEAEAALQPGMEIPADRLQQADQEVCSNMFMLLVVAVYVHMRCFESNLLLYTYTQKRFALSSFEIHKQIYVLDCMDTHVMCEESCLRLQTVAHTCVIPLPLLRRIYQHFSRLYCV